MDTSREEGSHPSSRMALQCTRMPARGFKTYAGYPSTQNDQNAL